MTSNPLNKLNLTFTKDKFIKKNWFCSSTDLDLQKRIVLLSHAIMCAKSSTSRTASAAEGEFLHELEEKMEVSVM